MANRSIRSSSRRRNALPGAVLSVLLPAGVFAASLFAFSSILSRSFPPGNPTIFDRKIAQFSASDGERYNTVFVGSSRVYRHLIPVLFDEAPALSGLGIRSYNFGYYGSRALELPHLMRRVLAADREGKLKWVFIDVEPMAWDLEDVNLATARVASYHDATTLARAVRYAVGRDSLALSVRIAAAARHLVPFFRHILSWSEGSTWLKNAIRPSGEWRRRSEELWRAHRRGYLSLESSLELADEEERGRLEERKALFEKKRGKFLRNVRRLRSEPPGEADLDRVMVDVLAKLDRMVRDHGATAIFISNPILRPRNDLKIAHETDVIENFFPFDDPDSCAVLFDPDYRFDEGHLSSEGAAIYTSLLADRFGRWFHEKETKKEAAH